MLWNLNVAQWSFTFLGHQTPPRGGTLCGPHKQLEILAPNGSTRCKECVWAHSDLYWTEDNHYFYYQSCHIFCVSIFVKNKTKNLLKKKKRGCSFSAYLWMLYMLNWSSFSTPIWLLFLLKLKLIRKLSLTVPLVNHLPFLMLIHRHIGQQSSLDLIIIKIMIVIKYRTNILIAQTFFHFSHG